MFSHLRVVFSHVLFVEGFVPLFSHAASHNLRIIALNLRDYPGSTPNTQAELKLLCSSNVSEQATAVRAQGQEIAAFLKHLVITEEIPPVQVADGQKTGGIILLSWSLGNVWTMSMFGNADHLESETKSILEKSLHTWVLYGERAGRSIEFKS